MINNKIKKQHATRQELPAGIVRHDSNIEFFGIAHNKTVIWSKNGKIFDFEYLETTIYNKLKKLFLSDETAKRLLCRGSP